MIRTPFYVISLLLAAGAASAPAQAAESAKPAARNETPCVPSQGEATAPGGIPFFRDCADTPEMAALPAGEFEMGDPYGNGHDYEHPLHRVRVDAFSIARTEVTSAQWARCVAAGGCVALTPPEDDKPENPVANVSWDEANQYTAWLSRRTGQLYRLPTEAEWEYAARAGSKTQFTWGNLDASSCKFANAFDRSGRALSPTWTWSVACDDGFGKAAPVGSYPANAWGLFDMLGNVWEWVDDCWHSDYQGAPTTAISWAAGECTKRVNRGGGWGNHPRSLRISNRDGDKPSARSEGMGFRVARGRRASPPPAAAPVQTQPPAPAPEARQDK